MLDRRVLKIPLLNGFFALVAIGIMGIGFGFNLAGESEIGTDDNVARTLPTRSGHNAQ